jgi:uncharacterized protein with PIN domain
MTDEGPSDKDRAQMCAACGSTLIVMSYGTLPDEDPRGADRPNLKCVGCGQRYLWRGDGWEPIPTG